MSGALHIAKLDCVDKFESDREAAEVAEIDGIKIIKDLPIDKSDDDFAYYVDTPKNRKVIKEHSENVKGLDIF